MKSYNCVKCGGPLEPAGDEKVTRCPWCKNFVAIPKISAEKFNQANQLRMSNQFDRAAVAFQELIGEDPEDAECYWNLLLCRYGIEYVDDSDGSDFVDDENAAKVPTCHRMSYDSILEDDDYKKALQYADGASYQYYQEQAALIDRKLREIVQIARTQEDYDVFISFKDMDTDEFGNRRRTTDSQIGQVIYDKLTEKGFRVFYSRVTLRNKGGQDFEPLIFAALNSARMMLVVGTSREHMEAPWVRNEWGRYRELMSRDKSRSRHFAIIFRDMTPEEFPEEFEYHKAQAFRADTLGYELDVVMGVENLLGKKTAGAAETEKASFDSRAEQEKLLKKGNNSLRAGNTERASESFREVLDLDARNAKAWWGLFETMMQEREDEEITSPILQLSRKEQNALDNALNYANADGKRKYQKKYEQYAATYKKTFEREQRQKEEQLKWEQRQNRLAEEQDRLERERERKRENAEKFRKEFQRLQSYTSQGTDFDWIYYDSTKNELYTLAASDQKRELDQFCEKYEANRVKYLEQKQLLESGYPEKKMREEPESKKLVERKEYLKAEKDKLAAGIRDIGAGTVIYPLAALIPWGILQFKDWERDVPYLLFNTFLFLTLLFGVATLIHLIEKGISDGRDGSLTHEAVVLLLALIPSAALYFGALYLVYREALPLESDLRVDCIFYGAAVLAFIIFLLVLIILIFACFWAAVALFVVAVLVLSRLDPTFTYIDGSTLQSIGAKYYLVGFAVLAVAVVVRLILVSTNSGKVSNYKKTVSELLESIQQYESMRKQMIQEIIEEYTPYIDKKYLDPWREMQKEAETEIKNQKLILGKELE